ncbi:hypothetical protein niasHT_038798 [Heterodera trifolii]|uniref:Ubiquitin-like protease family profile domain-containing protein n=1 Tax=Heterodera trifolii TaxID=157864 RepID=A0ABD2IAD0_9BILA
MPSKKQKQRAAQRTRYVSSIESETTNETGSFGQSVILSTPSTRFSALSVSTPNSTFENASVDYNKFSGDGTRKRLFIASPTSTQNLIQKKKGGRPRKRLSLAGPGRGHRKSSSSTSSRSSSIHTYASPQNPETNDNDIELNSGTLTISRNSQNTGEENVTQTIPIDVPAETPETEVNMHVEQNYGLFTIPQGPPISSDGRVAPIELFASRAEFYDLCNGEHEMCDDYVIYAYLRYLSSIMNNKRIAVLAPFYSDIAVHFGPGAINLDPIDYCYNHTADYELLLITVCFPGHYALIIFDQTERKCLFIDSLPPSLNLTTGFFDRLFDSRFPGYDENRAELLMRTICQLTPGLQQNDFAIEIVPPSAYTCQTDGINCGFFTLLYAESYLMNGGCLLLENLDINAERNRILSQLAHLLLTDDVPYIPRNAIQQQNAALLSNSFNNAQSFTKNPRSFGQRNIFMSHESSVHSNTSPRRSERIASRNASRESSIDPQQNISVDSNPLTKRCHLRHRDYPCADVRSLHTPVYYDSGILGDKKCDFCSALLFNSEASTKKGKTSSWYCCKFGKVSLPEITEPPAELLQLATDITPEAKEYRQHQNTYNSLLAFASVSVGHQENTTDGSVCFMLNGVFVRRISSLFSGNSTPSFAQLFILDPEAALEQRMQNTRYGGDRVNHVTLKKLDLLLRQYHPLAKQLLNFHEQYKKALQERGPDAVQNFRLTLLEARITPNDVRDSTLHSRQTNLPTEGTLFSVWTESERPPVQHGIWITTADGELRKIQPYHPQTDTLCYPLVIPCGDDGYHRNLTVKATKNHEDKF